jgi:hypothetical protein
MLKMPTGQRPGEDGRRAFSKDWKLAQCASPAFTAGAAPAAGSFRCSRFFEEDYPFMSRNISNKDR